MLKRRRQELERLTVRPSDRRKRRRSHDTRESPPSLETLASTRNSQSSQNARPLPSGSQLPFSQPSVPTRYSQPLVDDPSTLQLPFEQPPESALNPRANRKAKKIIWVPVSARSREHIRKMISSAYSLVEPSTNEETQRQLVNLVKLVDKKVGRTLIPSTAREKMFDQEKLTRRNAEMQNELEPEIKENARFQAQFLGEEKLLEEHTSQVKALQRQIDDDQFMKAMAELKTQYPLFDQDLAPNDYVHNLFKYPSSLFSSTQ
ncbi:uncharacterized protein BYT42DRAFT_613984 [Radiomyces spectabilis]|uniref:uncharacterized protein n=1 Tax=Radiomyces spectabilis TaxID=64574 RepID=UPI00221E6FE1|nr:uncharacterized protein BYT42DRAFT_613984 [Radiomyces spectabilis]KAI8379704.1 hypothetical protein BYT42DRAFT_613984 [Radiomyces spectabilis]